MGDGMTIEREKELERGKRRENEMERCCLTFLLHSMQSGRLVPHQVGTL